MQDKIIDYEIFLDIADTYIRKQIKNDLKMDGIKLHATNLLYIDVVDNHINFIYDIVDSATKKELSFTFLVEIDTSNLLNFKTTNNKIYFNTISGFYSEKRDCLELFKQYSAKNEVKNLEKLLNMYQNITENKKRI